MIEEKKLVDLYFRSLIHPDINNIFLRDLSSWHIDYKFESYNTFSCNYGIPIELDPEGIYNEGVERVKETLEKYIVSGVFLKEFSAPMLRRLCSAIFNINLMHPHYIVDHFSEYIEIIRFYSIGHTGLSSYMPRNKRQLFHSPNYSLNDDIYYNPKKYIKYLPGKKKRYTEEELDSIIHDPVIPDIVAKIARGLKKEK